MTDTATTTTTPPARQDAFHALGTEIPEGLSIREGLEYANMAAWDVRKVPLFADTRGGRSAQPFNVPVANTFAVVRTSPFTGQPEVLGTVGNRWTPFQNEDTANLLEDVADMSGARLTTALVLNGGRKTGLVLKMPEGMTFTSPVTGEHDVTDLNLVVFNNHDGYGSLSANITPIRPFCANQQPMIESTARTRFMLRHTGDAVVRMAELREMVGESMSYRHIYQNEVERMIGVEVDDDIARRELERLFHATDPELTERQRELRMETVGNVLGLYQGSITVAPFKGTAYGVYNALTEYTDHVMRVVVPDGQNETTVRAMRTLQSDGIDGLKQRAFAQLLPAA